MKKDKKMNKKKKENSQPCSTCSGKALAIGMGVGVALGVAMDNIALGPALGISFWIAFSQAFGKEHQCFEPQEWEGNKKYWILGIVGLIVVLTAAIVGFLFFKA